MTTDDGQLTTDKAMSKQVKQMQMDVLAKQFDFEPPRHKGMGTVEACEGILSGGGDPRDKE